MNDPLNNFDWDSLFARYDDLCGAFTAGVPYLYGELAKADSDRKLYDLLVIVAQNEIEGSGILSLQTYEAILYWKLYSQPAAVKNICHRLNTDKEVRSKTSFSLWSMGNSLPHKLKKETDDVIRLVKRLGEFGLFGMASPSSLPARTTLLHFIYPQTVPIFDKMVLQAVGVEEKNANQSLTRLMEYVPFAWQMASSHSGHLARYPTVSPLGLIDMALWVIRGGGARCLP